MRDKALPRGCQGAQLSSSKRVLAGRGAYGLAGSPLRAGPGQDPARGGGTHPPPSFRATPRPAASPAPLAPLPLHKRRRLGSARGGGRTPRPPAPAPPPAAAGSSHAPRPAPPQVPASRAWGCPEAATGPCARPGIGGPAPAGPGEAPALLHSSMGLSFPSGSART